MLYEVAIESTARRHIVKDEAVLYQWMLDNGIDKPLYHSVYCYRNEDKEFMEGRKAHEWGDLQRSIQWVPIDIDRGDDTAEACRRKAAFMVMKLIDLGLSDDNMRIFFSGRGYHIMIHEGCFNFYEVLKNAGVYQDDVPFIDLPYIVKETMLSLPDVGDKLDPSLYQRNGFIRTEHSLNKKSGLYKIQISRTELLSSTPAQIEELAKTRRFTDVYDLDEYYGDGELEKFVVTNIPPIRSYLNIVEPMFEEYCIYKMLTDGPVEGRRHDTVLRIASHLKRSGIPSDIAKDIVLKWNNGSLEPSYVMEIVEKSYNRDYNYGCSDRLRKKLCHTRCKHYIKKDIVETPATFDELIAQIKTKDYIGELNAGTDIAKMLGIPMAGSNFIVTKGEVVSLLGITKCGKSTFMKHIALGLDFNDMSKYYPEYRRKSIYYTGEESPDYWMLMCCKILENCNLAQALANKDALIDKYQGDLSHVMPMPTSAKLAGVRKHIETYGAEQVFFDTLDHFVDKSKGAAGIEAVMLDIQNICAEYGIIAYIVSQVSRQDSRDNIVKLFSGKGSGAIENQSRKVLGLSLTETKYQIKLELLANSYGDSGQECLLQMYSSSRLRKI